MSKDRFFPPTDEKRKAAECVGKLIADLSQNSGAFSNEKELATFLRRKAVLIEYGDSRLTSIMNAATWPPDNEVLRSLEQQILRLGAHGRIPVGDDVIDVYDLLVAVREGTPLGRRFYMAFSEGVIDTMAA